MKSLKLVSSILIFIAIVFLSFQVITRSFSNQLMKADYAELNHFKYGLFSVNSWKERLSDIITDEIDKLYLTKSNKATLRQQLEVQLGVFIDKVYARIQKSNEKSLMNQAILDSLVDINEVKKGIPEYARALLKEMSTSKTEAQIKGLLKDHIDRYMDSTFDIRDPALRDQIIKNHGAKDVDEARLKVQQIMQENHSDIAEKTLIIVILAIILFIFEGLTTGPLRPAHYILLTFTLLTMMIVGVTTPMIDMEAKISQLTFMLFDHKIVFENQILYFQSKSIIDVFRVMITHRALQMKLVGVLVIGFSIIFPILKMFSSMFYYFNSFGLRKNRLVNFFVFQSGKWSMADVLVVAIFMAYIGFNGIISSQLENMASTSPNLEVITTNGTSLQPGYFLFLSYTILAMFLSGFVKKRPYVPAFKQPSDD